MARLKRVPTLAAGIGKVVPLAEGSAEFIDITHTQSGEWRAVLELRNGDQRLITADEFLAALGLDDHELFQAPTLPADETRFNSLPAHTQTLIIERYRDLTRMWTGDPFGNIETGQARGPAHVDPDFDPQRRSIPERYAAMSAEIEARPGDTLGGHAPATLREQCRKVRKHGMYALVHGRFGYRARGTVPADLEAIIDTYLDEQDEDASTRGIEAHLSLLRMALDDSNYDQAVSDSQLRRAFDHCRQGRHVLGNATTKRSVASRPRQHTRGWTRVSVPYEVLEIDSTPLDLVLVDQYENVLTVVHLLTAECVLTRRVVGMRLVANAGPYDSREVCGLIWDCVRGAIGGAPGVHRATRLPAEVRLNPPTLPGRFGKANIDRGAQFNSIKTLGMLRGIGANVRLNDPATGWQKPHIEALFKILGGFLQKLPGYTGPSVAKRGKNLEKGPMLRVRDIEELLWHLIERVYHDRPHTQLRHPDINNRLQSPNEALDLYLQFGGELTYDLDLGRLMPLLDTRVCSLRPEGLRVAGDFYYAEEFDALRVHGLGEQGRKGLQLRVWYDDRHREFIYVDLPDRRPVKAFNTKRDVVPAPLADLLDRELRNGVGTGASLAERTAEVDAHEQSLVRRAWDIAVTPPLNRSSRPGAPGLAAGEPAPPRLKVVPDPPSPTAAELRDRFARAREKGRRQP